MSNKSNKYFEFTAAKAAHDPITVELALRRKPVKIVASNRMATAFLFANPNGGYDVVGASHTPAAVWENEVEGNLWAGKFGGEGWTLPQALNELRERSLAL